MPEKLPTTVDDKLPEFDQVIEDMVNEFVEAHLSEEEEDLINRTFIEF